MMINGCVRGIHLHYEKDWDTEACADTKHSRDHGRDRL